MKGWHWTLFYLFHPWVYLFTPSDRNNATLIHKIPLAIPILVGLVDCPSQSRQSAKIFLQLSELGLPQPLTRRWEYPPPLVPGGGAHSLGVGESQFREGTCTVVFYTYMYFVLPLIPYAKSNNSVFQASPSITLMCFYPSAPTLWSSVLRPFHQRAGCASWTSCDKEIGIHW